MTRIDYPDYLKEHKLESSTEQVLGEGCLIEGMAPVIKGTIVELWEHGALVKLTTPLNERKYHFIKWNEITKVIKWRDVD
jgi:hypothetical protein